MKQLILASLTFTIIAVLALAAASAQPLADTARNLLAAGASLDINSPLWSVVLAIFAGVWIWMIATALRITPERCSPSSPDCAR